VFERFTDRARRVLVLAQEEASLLSHSFIGTEHILLGLIHEGDGLAAKALESLGISLQAVREKVAETIGPAGSGPAGSPPFTPRAKKVLELALREALQLGHNYIGTEHLLLGLVREGEGVAAQVLQSFGADLGAVRERVLELLVGYQGQDLASAQRASGAGTAESPKPRYPYKILSGRERSLGSPSLGLRVVGVLLYDDGISVIWRLVGVPGAVTRLIEGATAYPESPRDVGSPFRPRPAIPSEPARPRPRRREAGPFIVLSDDLGTSFRATETTYQPLEDGEWAGNCEFAPALREAASTLTLTWENDSITLTL
jgi:hypothetical protein